MAGEIKSKKGTVSKSPCELYMAFADMRNLLQFVPQDKKEGIEADYDYIHAQVQGFNVGIKVAERTPYSKIEFMDDGAPFSIRLKMHFDPAQAPFKKAFQIVLDAAMNYMLKTSLGSKLQEGLDQIVDGLVAASEGRMPEGFDPSSLNV